MIAAGEPWLAYLERRNDAALVGYRKLLASAPGDPGLLAGLADTLIAKEDFNGAAVALRQLQAIWPNSVILALTGYARARAGDAAEAQKILRHLEEQAGKRFVSPLCFAVLYMGLGDADRVFRYLELARTQQDSALIFLRTASLFDPIRPDPRFQTLLAEIHLSDQFVLKKEWGTAGVNR